MTINLGDNRLAEIYKVGERIVLHGLNCILTPAEKDKARRMFFGIKKKKTLAFYS